MPTGKANLRWPKFRSKTFVKFNGKEVKITRVHMLRRKHYYELDTGELVAEDELSLV